MAVSATEGHVKALSDINNAILYSNSNIVCISKTIINNKNKSIDSRIHYLFM